MDFEGAAYPYAEDEANLPEDWAEAKRQLQEELAQEAQARGDSPLARAAGAKAVIRTPPNQRITPARHVQALSDAVQEAIGITSFGTYYGHSPTPERAVDIFTASRAQGDRAANWILANWERFGSRYLIWWQRINWNDGNGWTWMADRGGATQNHLDHLHWAAEETAPALPAPTPPREETFVAGTTILTNPHTQAVVDCFGAEDRDAAVVGVWALNGQKNQLLRIHDDGRITFEHSASGRLLDGDGSSDIVHLYKDHRLRNQRWDLTEISWGLLVVTNRQTGNCLTANGVGERLTQEPWTESADQVWTRTQL